MIPLHSSSFMEFKHFRSIVLHQGYVSQWPGTLPFFISLCKSLAPEILLSVYLNWEPGINISSDSNVQPPYKHCSQCHIYFLMPSSFFNNTILKASGETREGPEK